MSLKFNLLVFAIYLSCNTSDTIKLIDKKQIHNQIIPDENLYKKIKEIPLPAGYKRTNNETSSFAEWLRNVDLKKNKTVYKFDGTPKYNQKAQFAVLDISVGNKDLQQCADAVMRLRAEYLYNFKKFDEITFTDNEGTAYKFHQPYTRENFDAFLQKVFAMCGTASLQKQLSQHIEMKNIQPGDVLIHGGFPGHAEIVMDVATNSAGKKIYLLAQSYMPAQDIHVLVNPSNKLISPWYEVNDETIIETPEYTFTKFQLKRW